MGEDSDSGIEDAILQMENFQLDDDEGMDQVVVFLFSIIHLLPTYKANRSLCCQFSFLRKAQQIQLLMYTIMRSQMT